MLRKLTTYELTIDGRTYEDVRDQIARAFAMAEHDRCSVDDVLVRFDGTARFVQWKTDEEV